MASIDLAVRQSIVQRLRRVQPPRPDDRAKQGRATDRVAVRDRLCLFSAHELRSLCDLAGLHLGFRAKADAARFCGGESGLGARDDHAPFDMGDHGKDRRIEFTGLVAGVESLTDAYKACALVSQLSHDGHDVRNGSTETVEPPHNQFVALADLGKGAIQPVPYQRDARDPIFKDRVATRFGEGVILKVGILFASANANISDQPPA